MPTPSVIRYAPSGPLVTTETGGTAELGPGFPLRLSETMGSTGGLVLSGSPTPVPLTAGGDLQCALAAPNNGRRYRCEAIFPLEATLAGSHGYTGGFQYSIDGTNWFDTVLNLGGALGAAGAAQANVPAVVAQGQTLLGSQLPLPAGIPDNTQFLYARFTPNGSVNLNIPAGVIVQMRLWEML